MIPLVPAVMLHTADIAVIAVYFAAMAAFAVYFGRRNKDTEGYFLGGRHMPGWAVGLSLIGTSISSISFLALPAAAFALDWRLHRGQLRRSSSASSSRSSSSSRCSGPCLTPPPTSSSRIGWAGSAGCTAPSPSSWPRCCGWAWCSSSFRSPSRCCWTWTSPGSSCSGGCSSCSTRCSAGIEVVIWTDVVQTIVLWGGAVVVLIYRRDGTCPTG